MSKTNEKHANSPQKDSDVNSQAKYTINTNKKDEESCGCTEDSKNYMDSIDNSCGCTEDSKNEIDKDTCEIGHQIQLP